MKFKYFIIIALLALTSCTNVKKEPTKVVAHRGFWNDLCTENTISSLYNANKLGCHAAEFDVRLTKDKQLVVVHDNVIQGHQINASTLSDIKKITFEDGESIPTLEEYLDQAKDMNINLILELKETSSFQNNTYAVQSIQKIINERELIDKVSFISFSTSTCKLFLKYFPTSKIYYLCSASDPDKIISPEMALSIGLAGIDYQDKILIDNPNLIKECHDLGLEVNVWTVNEEEYIQHFINEGVDFITTDHPDLAMELTKK